MKHIPFLSLSRFSSLLTLGLAAIVLVACSPGSAHESSLPDPNNNESSQEMPTAASGELTVSDLIKRVNAAWPDVTSMRITSISGAVPTENDGESTPEPEGMVTTKEWVAPNKRRIIEHVDDAVVNEQIYIDGTIYMWGMFVDTSVAPEVGPQTWVTVDPDVVPPDTPVGYRVTYITREPGPPFGTITEDMRNRPVSEAGTVQVEGRSCTVYSFVDTTQLGERINYELALDENDFPCQLVQRAGGFQNSSVYKINDPDIEIIAPNTPTPVSGTPEG